jgi:hypothetical protein
MEREDEREWIIVTMCDSTGMSSCALASPWLRRLKITETEIRRLCYPCPSRTQASAFTIANLVRSAKSGSSWGMNELIAFNIEVIDVNAQTFFGNAILPQLTIVSSTIWKNPLALCTRPIWTSLLTWETP